MTAYDDLVHARQRVARELVAFLKQNIDPVDDLVRALEALIDAKLRLHVGSGYDRNVYAVPPKGTPP